MRAGKGYAKASKGHKESCDEIRDDDIKMLEDDDDAATYAHNDDHEASTEAEMGPTHDDLDVIKARIWDLYGELIEARAKYSP